jgi:hypothetical protein
MTIKKSYSEISGALSNAIIVFFIKKCIKILFFYFLKIISILTYENT